MSDEVKKCPKCGNECAIGDLYCLKCRYKFSTDNSNNQDQIKHINGNTKNYNKNIQSEHKDALYLDPNNSLFTDENGEIYSCYVVNVTAQEAKKGTEISRTFAFANQCEACKADGFLYSTTNPNCKTCHGTGLYKIDNGTNIGCPECEENGCLMQKRCLNCQDGLIYNYKDISFYIPPRTKNDQVFYIGKEELWNNNDLYVAIKIIENNEKNKFIWVIILTLIWVIFKIVKLIFS